MSGMSWMLLRGRLPTVGIMNDILRRDVTISDGK